jgi:hypothetical protein
MKPSLVDLPVMLAQMVEYCNAITISKHSTEIRYLHNFLIK